MTPERVVIKGFNGVALVRWLVGVLPTVAKITNDDGAEAVRTGRSPEFVVGFPLFDVFVWDVDTGIKDGDKPNWSQFRPKFG
jgi:hypothetical protein